MEMKKKRYTKNVYKELEKKTQRIIKQLEKIRLATPAPPRREGD